MNSFVNLAPWTTQQTFEDKLALIINKHLREMASEIEAFIPKLGDSKYADINPLNLTYIDGDHKCKLNKKFDINGMTLPNHTRTLTKCELTVSFVNRF